MVTNLVCCDAMGWFNSENASIVCAHLVTKLGNLANISFSYCSTVLTILNVLPVVSYPLFIFSDDWEDPSNATNIFS